MKKVLLLSTLVIMIGLRTPSYCYSQSVGISGTGAMPDASALLDVDATGMNPKKGLLIPRLTSTERDAILSPAEALQIFNTTTKCFEAYVNGGWYSLACPSACTPPAIPTANAASSVICTSFTANWNASTGATSYYLDVSTNSGFSSFVTGYNNLNIGNITSYAVTGLTAGTPYWYRLRAATACVSGNSTAINPTTASTPASAPTAATHTPTQTQIIWDWSDVGGVTGYQWNTTNTYPGAGVNTVGSSTYTQTGLTCNTTYTLYVWAYNACGYFATPVTLTQSTSACCAPGALYTAFGTGGAITEDVSGNNDLFTCVAVDGTGIYLGGYGNGPSVCFLEKRDINTGAIIWTLSYNSTGGGDVLRCMAIDATAIYVGGYDAATKAWRIDKRNLTTGAIIWTKYSGGTPDDGNGVYGITVDGTGVYATGGDVIFGSGIWTWRSEKRDLDGNLLWTQPDATSRGSAAQGTAVDGTGMYVVGPGGASGEWRIEKRNLTTGAIIWAQATNPTAGTDWAAAVTADSTGIYVVGYDDPGNGEWRIEKRDLTTGALIGAFGTGGVVTSDPSAGYDYARGISIDGTGIYVVGDDRSPGNMEWRIEKRDLTTGAIIWTQTNNPSGGSDYPAAVGQDGAAIYPVGEDASPGGYEFRLEKRCK